MSGGDLFGGGGDLTHSLRAASELTEQLGQDLRAQRQAAENLDAMRHAQIINPNVERRAAEQRAEDDRRKQLAKLDEQALTLGSIEDATRAVVTATTEVQRATVQVQSSVQHMADETDRAQRLAIRVAIGTGIGGAILGGFVGAVAARLVGGG